MSSLRSGWRLPLRLAWRDVRRHMGRSALAALLILLPVTAMATMLTLSRTATITDAESRTTHFANARAYVSFLNDPSPDWKPLPSAGRVVDRLHPPTAEQVARQLGAPAVPHTLSMIGFAPAKGGESFAPVDAQYLATDVASPLVDSSVTITSGRAPRAAGEVLVTDHGAHLGLPGHGRVRLAGGFDEANGTSEVTVVGHARTTIPSIAMIGAEITPVTGAPTEFAVGGTKPIDETVVAEWSPYGAGFTSRDVPADAAAPLDPALVLAALVGAMAFICVTALLAGPAFAAGATRHRRTLGLIASNGAERVVLRRIILAQALVLGTLTALIGISVGAALGVVLGRIAARRDTGVTPPVDVPVSWLLGLLLVSAVASMTAAAVPARSAGRTNLLAALRGQVSSRTIKKRWPALGVGLVIVGFGLLALAFSLDADTNVPQILIILGMPLVFSGAVLAVPFVLAATGHLASHLPVTARLGIRDVSRQRTRATASVGAVLATVAVFAGVSVFSASFDAYAMKTYSPQLPIGSATMTPRFSVTGPQRTDAQITKDVTDVAEIAGSAVPMWAQYEVEKGATLARNGSCGTKLGATPPIVALDEGGLAALNLSAAQRSTLTRGGLLVIGDSTGQLNNAYAGNGPEARMTVSDIRGGSATVSLAHTGARDNVSGDVRVLRCEALSLPAASVDFANVFGFANALPGGIVVTRATAAKHHLPVSYAGIRIMPTHAIDAGLEARLQAATPGGMTLTVEHGPVSMLGNALLLLTLGFGAIVLLTGIVSTLLNAAESQADAATLATVGAPAGMRRRIVGTQAAALGLIGGVVGLIVGLVPGLLLARVSTNTELAPDGSTRHIAGTYIIPWANFGVMLILIPLAAALICMIFTRRTPTLTRREA